MVVRSDSAHASRVLVHATVQNGEFRHTGLDHKWHMILECLNCGEKTDEDHPIVVDGRNQQKLEKGDRGHTNFRMGCRGCQRMMTVDLIDDANYPAYGSDQSETRQLFVAFVPRNCKIVALPTKPNLCNVLFEVKFHCEPEFRKVKFSEEGDFCDYDTGSGTSMLVSDVSFVVESN